LLEPGLIVLKVYGGYWVLCPADCRELRQDLRSVLQKCRPDRDITRAELQAVWERGEKDRFYPYGKSYAKVFASKSEPWRVAFSQGTRKRVGLRLKKGISD
jgi:hypothetical protein